MSGLTNHLAGVILVLSLVQGACGVTLGLKASPTEANLDSIVVPVQLSVEQGDAVASLQFDLHYDTETLRYDETATASSAQNAEKSAHANVLRPGVLRVVVAGLNRNAMATGPLVNLRFSASGGFTPTTSVSMESAIVSDPYGTAIPVTLSPNTIVLERSDGTLKARMATGTTTPSLPGDAYAPYRALVIALLCVAAAMTWSRRKPKKGHRR